MAERKPRQPSSGKPGGRAGHFKRFLEKSQGAETVHQTDDAAEALDPVSESRPPIPWAEVAQIATETTALQDRAVQEFCVLLDSLAGTSGQSPKENKALARMVNNLARRRGIDLTYNGQTVNVRWSRTAFEARSTANKATLVTRRGFPPLSAKATPRAEGLDIRPWLDRQNKSRRSTGVGGPS